MYFCMIYRGGRHVRMYVCIHVRVYVCALKSFGLGKRLRLEAEPRFVLKSEREYLKDAGVCSSDPRFFPGALVIQT